MRKIKFRVWDKKRKIMHKVYQIGFSDGVGKNKDKFYQECVQILMNKTEWVWLSDEEFDLLQYVDLKDKNGKEIYEGDIIKVCIGYWYDYEDIEPTFNYNISERVFIQEIKIDLWAGILRTFKFDIDYHEPLEIEVIGNIYENPELLETK